LSFVNPFTPLKLKAFAARFVQDAKNAKKKGFMTSMYSYKIHAILFRLYDGSPDANIWNDNTVFYSLIKVG